MAPTSLSRARRLARRIARAIVPAALAAALAVSAVALSAQPDIRPPAADPRACFAGLRQAFLDNDPSALAAHFPADGRVFVALSGIEPGLWLGPGQRKAFFERLFRSGTTVRFDLTAPLSPPDGPGTSAKVRWQYRERASGTLRTDEVYVTFQWFPERAEWQVVEMRRTR